MRQLPDAGDPVVDETGALTDQAREFMLQLNNKLDAAQQRYDDLSDLQAKVPKPINDKIYGIVTGQGLAMWDGSNWVLAADDTTLIT